MNSQHFEILADPSRRQILDRLRTGERQVNDLVATLGIQQSGVSRHLRILRESGFVKVRPEGQMRFYSLEPAPFRDLQEWLGPFRALWEARLERFGKALARRKSEK